MRKYSAEWREQRKALTAAAERLYPNRLRNLEAFVYRIARMKQDGEETDGEPFVMENDDAVDTLNALISEARAYRDSR
jgi:hypothetical protein